MVRPFIDPPLRATYIRGPCRFTLWEQRDLTHFAFLPLPLLLFRGVVHALLA